MTFQPQPFITSMSADEICVHDEILWDGELFKVLEAEREVRASCADVRPRFGGEEVRMAKPEFNTDRECLRALKDFLTYEQNVTPAMTIAYEDVVADKDLKEYIDALAEQIGDAWKMASDYLDATETDIAE